MLKQILSAIKISALALVLSFGLSYALAWAPPTQQPPNGNVEPPINVGADDQTKTGDICTSKGGTTKCLSVVSSAIDPAPIGSVVSFAGTTPPSGYLLCNGAAVSRTTYAALFTAIGTTFGAGDGSTTFNLPDLRGEFIRGLDNGRGVDAGRTLGSAQADELKSHTHTAERNPANRQGNTTGGTRTEGSEIYNTGATGGAETRPRNVAMNYIIKAVNNSEMVLVQSGTGDNLGDHTATQALNMGTNNILSGGSNGSYGALTVQGEKNTYSGIQFKNAAGASAGTLMMHPSYSGFFNATDNKWRMYVEEPVGSASYGNVRAQDYYIGATGIWASQLRPTPYYQAMYYGVRSGWSHCQGHTFVSLGYCNGACGAGYCYYAGYSVN